MEHQKVSPTPSKSARSIGWRILLTALAIVGMWNFCGGLGRANVYRVIMGWPLFLWWVWPYAALGLAWTVVAGWAILGRLRTAVVVMLVVLALSMLMLGYDVAHPQSRSQVYGGVNLASYYTFWHWWSRYGWNVQEPYGAQGKLFGPWFPNAMILPQKRHSQPAPSSQPSSSSQDSVSLFPVQGDDPRLSPERRTERLSQTVAGERLAFVPSRLFALSRLRGQLLDTRGVRRPPARPRHHSLRPAKEDLVQGQQFAAGDGHWPSDERGRASGQLQ